MAQQPQGPQQGQQGGGKRPGAMTMAMNAVAVKPPGGPKVLRIGLIQDGKIIEERILRKRETISIGTKESNHFILSSPNLPARFDLFQLVGEDYILNFTDDMSGRVGLPGGVQQLDQLRSSGGARNAGSHWQVKLNDNSRGKIVVGNTTLLFQFVVPPPITPRPQLPAAARGGFVAGIDWLFTAFVVFSYMTFFGFVIYLENADWPIQQGIAALPESIARMIFQEPAPPPEPVEETTEEPTEEPTEEVAENTQQRPSSGSSSSASSGANSGAGDPSTSAEARARIAEEAAAAAEALILGALSSSGGALADVLAGGAATGSAEDILAASSGVGVATSSGSGTLRAGSGGGTGSGEGGDLGQLNMGTGGGGMSIGEGSGPEERRVSGRINLEGGDAIGGSGDFDANLVVRQIGARLTAIRRCY
nr:hypothetical protein [Myxococcota bacterium]